MNILIKCDTDLLKALFNVNSFTMELLYFETGKLPIQFIVSIRRLMYLWNLLHRDPDDLISKVYQAQRENPSKHGDWYQMIQREKDTYDIMLSDEDISKIGKHRFRKFVGAKISKYAFSHLLNISKQHSKSKDLVDSLNHNGLRTQPYLLTSQLTTSQKQLLMSLRCKIYDVKSNFKNRFNNNMRCRICMLPESYENESHLLKCSDLMYNLSSAESNLKLEVIYGTLDTQVLFIESFDKIHSRRKLMLEL